MIKNGIAFIFKDGRVQFVKSYGYMSGYQIINYKVNPIYINVNLTDDIDDGFPWLKDYHVDCAYNNLKGLLDINNNIKSILKINSDVYRRYIKIKKIKEKCQSIEKTNT